LRFLRGGRNIERIRAVLPCQALYLLREALRDMQPPIVPAYKECSQLGHALREPKAEYSETDQNISCKGPDRAALVF
jgi:hypothetical protein